MGNGHRLLRNLALGGSATACLALACATHFRGVQQNDTPPEGWWKERGPVVPHDSFPADCSLCHAGSDWHTIRADFRFDHEQETGVALHGKHERAECLRCHNDRGPVAAFAARGCAGCHEDVHRGQLGQDCSACHDEQSFAVKDAVARHGETRFPLIGAHAATACWRCHPGAETGNFLGADPDCANCHAADLARATDPDHQALGFVDNCEDCHVPTSWSGASIAHTAWPLTGAHRSLSCDQCHAGGVYAGTPTDCAACHLQEYLATTNPNHTSAGFPTSCDQCHDTSSWFNASFNHSFPITSGPHGKLDCSDCHTDPMNYMTFSCLTCHAHSQAEMDDKHSEVQGYVYQSSACLMCHPDGNE